MDLNRFDRKIVEKACKKTIYNYDKLPIKDQLI